MNSHNFQMAGVSHLSENSTASIVEDTDAEDCVDHCSVKLDNEIVPKLRRTKSFLVCLTLIVSN